MKQHQKAGKKNKVGAYGEQIAAKFLQNKGFTILDTNYSKKWGEIDIVARETVENQCTIHFVEVKTVSYETKSAFERAVTHETWRPEDNVHQYKLKKLHRVIETWLLENNCKDNWQIDVVAVRIVTREKYATVKYIQNVIM